MKTKDLIGGPDASFCMNMKIITKIQHSITQTEVFFTQQTSDPKIPSRWITVNLEPHHLY